MVQPITMESVQPSHFSPSCSAQQYQNKIAAAVVGPLLMAVLTSAALILFCVGRFCLNQCGGAGPFRVMFHEEERELAIAQQYSARSRMALVALLAVAACFAFAGAMGVAAASNQLSDFTVSAAAIFTTHSDYIAGTVSAVTAAASAMAPLDVAVVTQTAASTAAFATKTRTYVQGLHELDALRSVFLFATVAAALLIPLLGLVAAYGGCHRFALALGIACFVLAVCLWINFLIPQAAANVFYDLCGVINGCHYCVVQTNGPCPLCKVNFFKALSECSPASAATYAPLAGAISQAANGAASSTLAALAALCGEVDCIGRVPASVGDVLSFGLASMLVGPRNQTATDPAAALTVEAYAATMQPGSAAAASVTTAYGGVTSYQTLALSVSTLNCSAANAFVEGYTPQGTFDALQTHLCPQTTYPLNPPQQIFSRLAAWVMILLVAAHILLVVLVLGHKRFRIAAVQDGRSADQSTWLLRPSAYAAYGSGASPRAALDTTHTSN